MNVAELYLQTAQLGFETTLEDSDRFYFAANRALLQVCKVRPAIRHCLINHKPLANLIRQDTFSPIEKIEDITYEAEGAKAYYFEADGNGVLYLEEYITDTGEWRIFGEIPLQSKQIFVPYKGFIKKQGAFVSGRIRLRFAGEYLYSVKNVALYQYLYGGEVADIPAYEAYTRYDVKKLVSPTSWLCVVRLSERRRKTPCSIKITSRRATVSFCCPMTSAECTRCFTSTDRPRLKIRAQRRRTRRSSILMMSSARLCRYLLLRMFGSRTSPRSPNTT